MVLVDITVDGEARQIYCDDKLYRNLIFKIRPSLLIKDKDRLEVVDGGEGAGKSVLAMQIAKIIDPSFDMSRVCFSAEEFINAVRHASKGQAVVFDEAFRGLSSRGSLRTVNNLIISLLMEMRQKNLFVIIVLPTIFMLDKYPALFRAKGLFHVYTKNGKRGRWVYFNGKKKKQLILLGKKMMSYEKPRSSFRGRFTDRYVIDEQEYRRKKYESLQVINKQPRKANQLKQRNVLIKHLISTGMTQEEISQLLIEKGAPIGQQAISNMLNETEDIESNEETTE